MMYFYSHDGCYSASIIQGLVICEVFKLQISFPFPQFFVTQKFRWQYFSGESVPITLSKQIETFHLLIMYLFLYQIEINRMFLFIFFLHNYSPFFFSSHLFLFSFVVHCPEIFLPHPFGIVYQWRQHDLPMVYLSHGSLSYDLQHKHSQVWFIITLTETSGHPMKTINSPLMRVCIIHDFSELQKMQTYVIIVYRLVGGLL